jgi:hypothetical protein
MILRTNNPVDPVIVITEMCFGLLEAENNFLNTYNAGYDPG